MLMAMRRALVARHQVGCGLPAGFFFVVDECKRVADAILHNEASTVMVFDGPRRREAANVHGRPSIAQNGD
jgi:hypothetical protein